MRQPVARIVGVSCCSSSPTCPSSSPPWAAAVEAFLLGGVDAENTRLAYRRALREAAPVIGIRSLGDLTLADLARYRQGIISLPLAPGTRALRLAAVRSFLTWSALLGWHALPRDTVSALLRPPRARVIRPYTTLSAPAVAALLAAASTYRDRALLALLVAGGLRVGEVAGLDAEDILGTAGDGYLVHVRRAKGGRQRIVPLTDEVAETVLAYLASTGRIPGRAEPLFRAYARRPKRLAVRTIQAIVHRCARRAGLPGSVTPHALRHCFATRVLASGANIMAVRALLGHTSIATTQRYVDHLALGELRAAIPLLPGGGSGVVRVDG